MTISSTSAAVAIPSSSTIPSALTPARKVLPPPGTSSLEPPSPATSTSMPEETVTTLSTSPVKSVPTTIPSGTLQTGTKSSTITSASSTPSFTSTTSEQESVTSSSAPAVTLAQGSGEPSVHIVHSITVVTATASTSTITQFPESTFSTPVAVTAVQDGTTSIGTPAVVTLLSTSTASDGLPVTWTHVYANPPTVAAVRAKSTFFHNTGAMAGIFTLVGIIAAFFLLGMLYLIRRSYRRRRDKMLARLRTLAPEHDYRNPFNDNGAEPVMHSLSYGITVDVSGSTCPAHNASPSYKVALFDVHGHSTSTDQLRSVQQMNTSGTDLAQITPQSTPSIYPATLPLNENEDETAAAMDQQPVEQSKIFPQTEVDGLAERPTERNTVIGPVVLGERPRTADSIPPPRPPRSVLRTGSVRVDSQWAKSWSSASTGSGSRPTA